MKQLMLFFLFFFLMFSVEAQKRIIGYQKDSVSGGIVPDGYIPLKTFTLGSPLEKGEEYKIEMYIITRMPKDLSGYDFDFWLFESDSTGRRTMNTETVRSEIPLPRLSLDSTQRRLSLGRYLNFFITPNKTSTHLTVGLKNKKNGHAPDILNYVRIYDLYIRQNLKKKSNCNCSRKEIPIGEVIKVTDETISVYAYDNRKIDGDIITLYLNDTVISEKLRLKRKRKKIAVTLKPGKNTLLLFAENLGDIPPNTAALEVRTKNITYEHILRADLEQSEYLTIFYEPDDEH